MSIDSSTKSTGYAIYDSGKLSAYDSIKCAEKDIDTRFENMATLLLKKLDEYHPFILVMEETVVDRNQQTQRFLTRLQGVAYAWCIMCDCEFNVLRPSEWRSAVGISSGRKKRDELKQESINMVKSLHNIDVNDDIAEAILIGMAFINMRCK